MRNQIYCTNLFANNAELVKKFYFVVEHVFNFKSKVKGRNKRKTKLVTFRWGEEILPGMKFFLINSLSFGY